MYKVHLRRALIFMVVGLVFGYFLAKRQPSIYEARTEVQVSALQPAATTRFPKTIRRLLQPVNAIGIDSEAGVLKSEGLFVRAVERVAKQTGDRNLLSGDVINRLYMMYDVIVPPGSNQYQPEVSKVLTRSAPGRSPSNSRPIWRTPSRTSTTGFATSRGRVC